MEYREPSVELWWVLALGGIVSILFGIAALAWPGLTLVVLVWLYGAYALVYGIVQLIGMVKAIGARTTWWRHALVGVVSVLAGIYVLSNPLISGVVLAVVIAIWAIVVGVAEVVAGITRAQFLAVVAGVITVLFGFVLLGNPAAGALALVWVIGLFALVRGALLLIGAFMAPTRGRAPS